MKARLWLLPAPLMAAAILLACNGGDNSDGAPTASSTPSVLETARPTATPSIEDLIGAAYLRYWDVYADAVFNLEESRLEDVMTGPQLQRTLDEIDSLRERGRAAKIEVEHNFFVADIDGAAGTATIRDDYRNSSYEIDAETKEMVGDAAPGTVVSDNYFLVKDGDVWKVRDGIRQGQ